MLKRIGGVVARLTAGARSVRNRDPRAADARPRRGTAIATRRRDDQTQAPHRHSDFPHGAGRGITLDPRYSSICGYTESDLDTVFAPELPGLDRDTVREWYNGYGWLGEEKVYNPFDILLLFDSRKFSA